MGQTIKTPKNSNMATIVLGAQWGDEELGHRDVVLGCTVELDLWTHTCERKYVSAIMSQPTGCMFVCRGRPCPLLHFWISRTQHWLRQLSWFWHQINLHICRGMALEH